MSAFTQWLNLGPVASNVRPAGVPALQIHTVQPAYARRVTQNGPHGRAYHVARYEPHGRAYHVARYEPHGRAYHVARYEPHGRERHFFRSELPSQNQSTTQPEKNDDGQ